MRVRFHPSAAAEVERAQAWYEERSALAAAGFLQELTRAVRRIRIAPERYPTAEHGTRRIVLEQFPLAAFYVVRRNEVFVVAVAHHKRRPGYWASRTHPAE
jgi:plasmid stabilization system protein ParE